MPNNKKKQVLSSKASTAKKVAAKSLFSSEKASKKVTTTTKKNDQTPGKALTSTKMPGVPFETEEKSLYEYAIGVKNIAVSAKSYKESGVYVSKKMAIEGNVREVTLEATEEHPVFDSVGEAVDRRRTSIEYYITMEEKPSVNDWIPILPQGERTVKSERLMLKGNTATLRFQCQESSVVVYKDGVQLSTLEYVIAGKGREVRIEKVDRRSIYTIDYLPSKEERDPWKIEVSGAGTRKKKIDRFPGGTNHNKTVLLSKYPFVDMGYINSIENYDPNSDSYRPFEVYLKNANIIGPGKTTLKEVLPLSEGGLVHTKNKTLYKEERWSDIIKYDLEKPYLSFDYYTWKDRVVFSETFNRANIYNQDFNNDAFSHGNAEIEVHYEYLATDFRIKAIMRRNTRESDMVAPALHEYKVYFKTEK